MHLILITFEVSKFHKSKELNFSHPYKKYSIFLTFLVLKWDISTEVKISHP